MVLHFDTESADVNVIWRQNQYSQSAILDLCRLRELPKVDILAKLLNLF